MNYLAHIHTRLDEPWCVVGACLPDWLRVADRRARLRRDLRPQLGADAIERDVVRGVQAHHSDDARFHAGPAFRALCDDVTRDFRATHPEARRQRPSVIAHILVEMLLDAALDARDATLLARFYEALDGIDVDRVTQIVSVHAPSGAARIGEVLARFRSSRFLEAYRADVSTVALLERVLTGVGHPPLPHGFIDVLPGLRARVQAASGALLSGSAAGAL